MSIILIYIIIIVILTLIQFPKTGWYSRLNQTANLQTIHKLCYAPNQSQNQNGATLKMVDRLYELCQRYSRSEPLIVESSIKISHRTINSQRLTIPITITNLLGYQLELFCGELCDLFGMRQLSQKLADYIRLTLPNTKTVNSTDLIVGFDWVEQRFKVYLDVDGQGLMSLDFNIREGNLRERFYQILSNNKYRAVLARINRVDLALLQSIGVIGQDGSVDHPVVYQVGRNSYHCVLRNPRIFRKSEFQELEKHFGFNDIRGDRITGNGVTGNGITVSDFRNWWENIEFQTYRISVISMELREGKLQSLSLYLRPHHLWVQVNKCHQVISNLF